MDGARIRIRGTMARRPVMALACLAAALACGCELRDEPVHAAGEQGIWPPPGPGRSVATVEYVEDYEAAARRAAAEGRPLFLVFGASWCRWTGELARGPLADRDVVARTRRFVCALVDADRDAATCRAHGVEAFPTVIVIDADGRERYRASGPGSAGGLATALDGVPDRRNATRRLAGEEKDVTR